MNKLLNGIDNVRTYIDDLLIKKLDIVLSKLKSAGFKVNEERSSIARNVFEYLSFKIISASIMPLPNKVEAVKNTISPATK